MIPTEPTMSALLVSYPPIKPTDDSDSSDKLPAVSPPVVVPFPFSKNNIGKSEKNKNKAKQNALFVLYTCPNQCPQIRRTIIHDAPTLGSIQSYPQRPRASPLDHPRWTQTKRYLPEQQVFSLPLAGSCRCIVPPRSGPCSRALHTIGS